MDVGVTKSQLLSQHGDLLRMNRCESQLACCSARVLVRLFQLLSVDLPEVFEFKPFHFQDLKAQEGCKQRPVLLDLLLPALAGSAPRMPASPLQEIEQRLDVDVAFSFKTCEPHSEHAARAASAALCLTQVLHLVSEND